VNLNELIADPNVPTDIIGEAIMPRDARNADQILAACEPITGIVSDHGVELTP
jgi:hypothetical protein